MCDASRTDARSEEEAVNEGGCATDGEVGGVCHTISCVSEEGRADDDFSVRFEAAVFHHHAKKLGHHWVKALSLCGLIHHRAAGRRIDAAGDRAFLDVVRGARGFGNGNGARDEYCHGAATLERNRSVRILACPPRCRGI